MNSRPERRRCIREQNSSGAMSTGQASNKKQCDTTQQPLNLADLSALSVRGLGFYRETVTIDPATHKNESETNNMEMNQSQSYGANTTPNNDIPSSPEEDANPHIRFASNEELLVEKPSTSKGSQRSRSKKQKPNVSQHTQTFQTRAKLTRKQKEELLNNSDVVFGMLNLETGCLLIDVDQFPTCVCLSVKNEHVQSTTLHYRPIQPCEDCCHAGFNPQATSSDMKFPLQAHRPITILAREILMQLYDIVRQGNVGSVSGSILLQLPSPVLTPTASGDSKPVSVASSTTVTLSVTATVTTVTSATTATVSLVNSKMFSESITSTNAGSCSNGGANSQLDVSVKISNSEEAADSSQHFVPATHMIPPASQLGGQTPNLFPQPRMIHSPHMGIPPHPHIAPPAHMGYPTHLVHPPHMGPPGPFVNPNHMVQQGHLIPRPQVVPTSRGTDLIPVPPTNMVSTSHSVTTSYMGAPSHLRQAVPPPPHSVPSYMVPTSQVISSPYMVSTSRELSGTYAVPTSHAVPTSQSTPKSSMEPPKSRSQSPVRKPVPARIMKRRRTIYPDEMEELIEKNRRNDGPFNMSGGAVSLIQESRNFATPNSTMVAATPALQVPRVSPSVSTGRPRPISFRRSTVTGAGENISTDDTIPRPQHRYELLQFIRNHANFEQNHMRMNAFHGMYNQDHFQNGRVQNFPGRGSRYSPGTIE